MYKTRQTCRICKSEALTPVISLGQQYLASYFDNARFPELHRQLPIDVVRCDPRRDENACGLVQLKHTVSPEILYSSYGYRSGINETMVSHLHGIARRLETLVELRAHDIVIDIGANDATLLKAYENPQILKVGFEPSNIAPMDDELPRNCRYIRTFFSAEAFRKCFDDKKAKLITSIAMFYDLDDPNQFVKDIASVLHHDGIWLMELSYLPSMLKTNSFDTILHEHLEYYHLAPLERLVSSYGLKVFDVEKNEVNGGSFRLYLAHAQSAWCRQDTEASDRLRRFRQEEQDLCLDQDAVYARFRSKVENIRKDLRVLLLDLKAQGHTIYGYGASTKGNVTLQYCGLNEELITAIAERNPAKFGTKTFGTNIPIVSEAEMRAKNPDYLVILPWPFADHFVAREKDLLVRGTKFIVPLPEVRIIKGEVQYDRTSCGAVLS